MNQNKSSQEQSERQEFVTGEYIQRLLRYLEAREQEGKRIEEEAHARALALKDAVNQEVFDLLRSLDGEDQKRVASTIYWHAGKYVRAATIAQAVGLPNDNMVCRWVYPQTTKVICAVCGEEFLSLYSSRGSKFPEEGMCEKCRAEQNERYKQKRDAEERELSELRSMPYAEYLKTEHWTEVREAALRRAGFRCQICNTNTSKLHVHHRTYENRGQEKARDVIVLCESCHQTFHENGQLSR